MKTPATISKGQKFVDEFNEVWVYLETITFLDENFCVEVKFVFIDEALVNTRVFSYRNVDDLLTPVLDL